MDSTHLNLHQSMSKYWFEDILNWLVALQTVIQSSNEFNFYADCDLNTVYLCSKISRNLNLRTISSNFGQFQLCRHRNFTPMTEVPAKNAISLGKRRFAAVKYFKGYQFLDIREYFINEKGQLQPGKRGVTLKRNQWYHLKLCFSRIDDKLVSIKIINDFNFAPVSKI